MVIIESVEAIKINNNAINLYSLKDIQKCWQ